MRQKFYDLKINTNGQKLYDFTDQTLEWIKKNNYTDFSNEVIPELMNKIFTFHNNNIHIDIGTIKKYNLANEICKQKSYSS